VIVFIVCPKNSSLKEYTKKTLNFLKAENNKKINVRARDVCFFVKEYSKKNKQAIGLTGEDLFKEYCLRERETELKIIKKIGWNDENALFKKPVLCLIGPRNKKLKKKNKVAIPDKYKTISKKYLNFLESKGFVFEKIYLNGSIETCCSEKISDLVIDIVYTGKTIEKLGLKVYDKIFESNFVIIGDKMRLK
jgi:ATP phosphoribosyltransferase